MASLSESPPSVDGALCCWRTLSLGRDLAKSPVSVREGLEKAVLTAVFDDEDDFRRGPTGRDLRVAVTRVDTPTFRRPFAGRSVLAFFSLTWFLPRPPSLEDTDSFSLDAKLLGLLPAVSVLAVALEFEGTASLDGPGELCCGGAESTNCPAAEEVVCDGGGGESGRGGKA